MVMSIRCALLFISISVSLFFHVCLGEIRYADIKNGFKSSLILIDVFEFTKTGRVELNVSNIFITNPNNLNFSRMGFFMAPRDECLDSKNATSKCFLHSSLYSIKMVYTFDKLQGRTSIVVVFNDTNPDEFVLFFQNCMWEETQVSMHVQSAMYNLDERINRRSYLSRNKTHQIWFYCALIFIYLLLAGIWVYGLFKTRRNVLRIHFVILVAVILRVLGFLLEVVNRYCIMKTGNTQGWSVFIALMSGFSKEIPTLPVVILGLNGWTYVKPKLDDKAKLLLKITIVTQFLNTIWRTVFIKNGPCGFYCSIKMVISRYFDVIIVFIIIFTSSVERTVNHLIWGGLVDGKAAINLRKNSKVQSVNAAFFLHNIFTYGVAVNLEDFPELSRYAWMGVLLGELLTLALYVFLGYILWPVAQNQILLIGDDEEKAATKTLKEMQDFYNRTLYEKFALPVGR